MKFECPHCHQHLLADPTSAGQVIRCPACNNRLQIPTPPKLPPRGPAPGAPPRPGPPGPRGPAQQQAPALQEQPEATQEYYEQGPGSERQVWKETDPTNPNMMMSLGIGVGLLVLWYLLLLPFNPPPDKAIAEYSGMQFVASLFYKHFLVSVLNTLFFTWAMAIVYLKHEKLKHQKAALLLDVLPMQLGKEISEENVGLFIDHVYALPKKLRDSMMVNRIRKALELFEIRQKSSDVREMMAIQSEIDGARINGSFTLLRAFLWAIPLLGFIGTVLGLSHAIGGMNFANVEDIAKIVGSINKVTSGLGTAFDATLLGLVLAMTLNFPLNSLAKQEDDNLSAIDAFCNEVLLPRLKDTPTEGEETSADIAESVMKSISGSQEAFLRDLNELSKRMNEYASSLDSKMAAFQKSVTEELVAKTTQMRTEVQGSTEKAVKDSLEQTSKYIGGLQEGINTLNKALKDLGEKQVVINVTKKRGWFSRD